MTNYRRDYPNVPAAVVLGAPKLNPALGAAAVAAAGAPKAGAAAAAVVVLGAPNENPPAPPPVPPPAAPPKLKDMPSQPVTGKLNVQFPRS